MSAPADAAHEPDLTPLLDLVLQLVMFFMLVVHFESEQRNEKVQLPKAGIAKGLVKNDKDRILFINLLPQKNEETGDVSRTNAYITVFEGTSMKEYTNQVQLRDYLNTEFEKDQKAAGSAVWSSGKGRSVVVLRADKDCTFRHVYDTMTTIKTVGYSEVQLRAQVDKTSGG